MIGMYVCAAIALVAAGAAVGILVMVCLGIKRDDRPGGFPAGPDDRIARAARKMTGTGARKPRRWPPRPAAGRHPAGLAARSACPPTGGCESTKALPM
jgi:hypothetical protein